MYSCSLASVNCPWCSTETSGVPGTPPLLDGVGREGVGGEGGLVTL